MSCGDNQIEKIRCANLPLPREVPRRACAVSNVALHCCFQNYFSLVSSVYRPTVRPIFSLSGKVRYVDEAQGKRFVHFCKLLFSFERRT